MTWESFLWAVAGGIIPAIIWLLFWLEEDEDPEPNRLLVISFLSGVLAIPVAFVLSFLWSKAVPYLVNSNIFPETYEVLTGLAYILGLAFSEEYAKYFIVHALIFWRRDYNEPADAMVYLITAALGFAAFENILYLAEPFRLGFTFGFEITNLRFIGSTLLHALSSGLLGYFIAGSFWKPHLSKEVALLFGLLFATLLHTIFNLLILLSKGINIEPAVIFLGITGIFILFAFERIKHTINRYYA